MRLAKPRPMEQDRASHSIHNHSYGIWTCNIFAKALKMVATGLIRGVMGIELPPWQRPPWIFG